VSVQYAGQQVETNTTDALFAHPHHPYTTALLAALPERATARRLPAIPGVVPGLSDRPRGCLFAPRCAFATDFCRTQAPRHAEAEMGDALCHTPLIDGVPRQREEVS
jgi:dipeptide transport system ATP-binding protein